MLKIACRFVETFKNYVSYISSHVNLVIRAVLNSFLQKGFTQEHKSTRTQPSKSTKRQINK